MGIDAVDDPLAVIMTLLATLPLAEGETQAVDAVRALEDIKGAAAAAQARQTRAFELARLAREKQMGTPRKRRGRGLSAEIALARRESPKTGRGHLDLARALEDMPHTMAALASGEMSERRAAMMVRATGHLGAQERAEVDRLVCADRARLQAMGDQNLTAEVRRRSYEVDPQAMAERLAAAPKQRLVNAGWSASVVDTDGDHTVDVTTPTGHRHRTTAPRPPGAVA